MTRKAGYSGSMLVLGGVDLEYATTDFEYPNLISESYWAL